MSVRKSPELTPAEQMLRVHKDNAYLVPTVEIFESKMDPSKTVVGGNREILAAAKGRLNRSTLMILSNPQGIVSEGLVWEIFDVEPDQLTEILQRPQERVEIADLDQPMATIIASWQIDPSNVLIDGLSSKVGREFRTTAQMDSTNHSTARGIWIARTIIEHGQAEQRFFATRTDLPRTEQLGVKEMAFRHGPNAFDVAKRAFRRLRGS